MEQSSQLLQDLTNACDGMLDELYQSLDHARTEYANLNGFLDDQKRDLEDKSQLMAHQQKNIMDALKSLYAGVSSALGGVQVDAMVEMMQHEDGEHDDIEHEAPYTASASNGHSRDTHTRMTKEEGYECEAESAVDGAGEQSEQLEGLDGDHEEGDGGRDHDDDMQ